MSSKKVVKIINTQDSMFPQEKKKSKKIMANQLHRRFLSHVKANDIFAIINLFLLMEIFEVRLIKEQPTMFYKC